MLASHKNQNKCAQILLLALRILLLAVRGKNNLASKDIKGVELFLMWFNSFRASRISRSYQNIHISM